jgi:hypothetical protein
MDVMSKDDSKLIIRGSKQRLRTRTLRVSIDPKVTPIAASSVLGKEIQAQYLI